MNNQLQEEQTTEQVLQERLIDLKLLREELPQWSTISLENLPQDVLLHDCWEDITNTYIWEYDNVLPQQVMTEVLDILQLGRDLYKQRF